MLAFVGSQLGNADEKVALARMRSVPGGFGKAGIAVESRNSGCG